MQDNNESVLTDVKTILGESNEIIKDMGDRITYFGNLTVFFYYLSPSSYKIEWINKMTGVSTSLSRLDKDNYLVSKNWSSYMELPNLSNDYVTRKSALVHFMNNADTVKVEQSIVADAKAWCLGVFSEVERIEPFKIPRFPKIRLQGLIGKRIKIIKRSEVVGEGTLLQVIGTKAEVKISQSSCFIKSKKIQTFNINQIFII